MKLLVLLVGLSVLAGCGASVTPMRLESRSPLAQSQDDLNREMIDAARKRERMSARGV
ncbi:MAG: hypothetical protein K5872_15750 [Rhizobiaceae bacterium]|nr:hypothetical protein [Rhizobiaceae bacterium]MCV0407678.1 hypothetical protein [Rhizobiaceae bacterium]